MTDTFFLKLHVLAEEHKKLEPLLECQAEARSGIDRRDLKCFLNGLIDDFQRVVIAVFCQHWMHVRAVNGVQRKAPLDFEWIAENPFVPVVIPEDVPIGLGV